MKIVIFCHSIRSDWNHGNAHFLRGVATELVHRGHQVRFLEPEGNWSLSNLVRDHGWDPVMDVYQKYPEIDVEPYDLELLDLDRELHDADLVLVHEWSDHELVRMVGGHRAHRGRYLLFFHDTHHRAATASAEMERYDLSAFDGALVFGEILRRIYLERGWCRRVFTWHEAADIRLFRPLAHAGDEGDLVWIGNWGDEERTEELREFLIEPVKRLGLRARVHGVRYSDQARRELAGAGIEYAGWLPNHRVPEVLAAHRMTVHVPRRPYVSALPGIPTIRVFEALACGTPLVSAIWHDTERLFHAGLDFLMAKNGRQMEQHLARLMTDPDVGRRIADRGLATIRSRHTCMHRAEQLLAIHRELTSMPALGRAVGG